MHARMSVQGSTDRLGSLVNDLRCWSAGAVLALVLARTLSHTLYYHSLTVFGSMHARYTDRLLQREALHQVTCAAVL